MLDLARDGGEAGVVFPCGVRVDAHPVRYLLDGAARNNSVRAKGAAHVVDGDVWESAGGEVVSDFLFEVIAVFPFAPRLVRT